MADEVYMEVIVGEEEAPPAIQESQLEDPAVNKTFVPVAWAAAYGGLSINSELHTSYPRGITPIPLPNNVFKEINI